MGFFYTKLLIEKGGFLMGESVVSLVIEGCLVFEIWEVLECLITVLFFLNFYVCY